ncbi:MULTISPECIES: hypothetical protein [unclassified Azospirillum]|uniref:hypothetical protein n=1 Tax=unclassified Azospirillum TaxID=2630922 RepID=UPI000B655B24|nr:MULTISPECIES: hypothetical protein [unclassified Azospirillum]SNS34356.1 hypothetical protein SAMN05880556_10412 [Azospirillum sp. RU38E]SNS52760.1 hypothetical protein SAMN05880591_10412 [Azospirillum sp. RU37A]
MGHQRLGKLPALRSLPEIVRYLVAGGTPTDDLVDQVTKIGQDALKRGQQDPLFVEALWLLARLPQAVGSPDVAGACQEIGLPDTLPTTLSEMLVVYDRALERFQRRQHADVTDLGEIARRAGASALGEAIQSRLPSLWQPTADDLRTTLSTLKGTESFAVMAHSFYANFVGRVIRYYVDRNIHKMVGVDRLSRSVSDLRTFDDAIKRHCNEAALIMRNFARDWMGKNHYRDGRTITRQDMGRFSAFAVEKIGRELEQRRGQRKGLS